MKLIQTHYISGMNWFFVYVQMTRAMFGDALVLMTQVPSPLRSSSVEHLLATLCSQAREKPKCSLSL
jgi:hypothetical protein